jgi:arylsulfatase A-like enzyme
MMPGPILHWSAVLMLALGCGIFGYRLYLARQRWLLAHQYRIASVLIGIALLGAAGVSGRRWLTERRELGLPAARGGRPNILLLVIDTQRADHLGLYGYQRRTSPVLDSVGRESLVFERAKSSSSWTLPSHASMMTGQPQHVHEAGLLLRPYLDRRLPTAAEALSGAGYATAGFVANTFWAGRRSGIDRGFGHYSDYYRNLADALTRVTAGRLVFFELLPKFRQTDIPGRRRAPEMNRDLLGWIDGLGGDRPFFAFVNYFDVHPPLLPPAPFRGRFAGAGAGAEHPGLDIGALADTIELPSPAELQERIDRYDESILSWDAEFGRLLAELDRRGLRNNTLIVVTADHGESFGEHGLLSHGHSLYGDQIDVPLVLSWPARLTQPARIAEPVSLDRLAATLLDAAGVEQAAIPGPSLLDPEGPAPPVLVEVGRRALSSLGWPSSIGWVAGLMTPEWRFLYRQDGFTELFDARTDPKELKNLGADSTYRPVVDSLKHRLDSLDVAKLQR